MADETANKGGCRRFALAGIGLIAVALIGVELFYKAPVPVIAGEPIPYDHLSNEALEPYPVRAEPRRDEADYSATAQERPDVRDCLIASERNKPVPDLRRLDWRAMRNGRDIEICMWRIFASYGSPERAKSWFDAHGLDGKLTTGVVLAAGSVGASGGFRSRMNGHSLIPNTGIRSLLGKVYWAETFSAGFDKNGRISSASYGVTVE